MRPLEIILLVLPLPYLLWPLSGRMRPRWLRLLPLAALAVFALQVSVEGYRWQMLPAYLLTAVLALHALYRLWRPARPDGRHLWGAAGGLLGTLMLALAAFLPWLLPVPVLPGSDGPYAVGTRSFLLVDNGRAELYGDTAGQPRRIMAQIWYPTDDTRGLREAPYIDGLNVLGPVLAADLGFPTFFLSHIRHAHTRSYLDAPFHPTVAGAPLLIFSHGLGGFRSQNTTLMRDLASHGYVVVAADHTYGNAGTVFPDGSVALYSPAVLDREGDPPRTSNTLVGVWADDIALLLDEVARWNGTADHWLHGRVDATAVGVFGHSTGGGAAFEFCGRDARCLALLGLDPWVVPVSDDLVTSGLAQPRLVLKAPLWEFDDAPENEARLRILLPPDTPDRYLFTVAGTAHRDFSDQPLLSPLTPVLGLSGPIDSAYSQRLQSAFVRAFFDRYLRGDDGRLLDDPERFPEVQAN